MLYIDGLGDPLDIRLLICLARLPLLGQALSLQTIFLPPSPSHTPPTMMRSIARASNNDSTSAKTMCVDNQSKRISATKTNVESLLYTFLSLSLLMLLPITLPHSPSHPPRTHARTHPRTLLLLLRSQKQSAKTQYYYPFYNSFLTFCEAARLSLALIMGRAWLITTLQYQINPMT